MNELLALRKEEKSMLKCIVGCTFFLASATSGAQSLRDPTLPPVVQDVDKTAVVVPTLSIGKDFPLIIVRGGHRYVSLESHLYAEGQRYGSVLIERISETEVWFRERNVLYKIPRFSGIQRNILVPNVSFPPTLPVTKQTFQ